MKVAVHRNFMKTLAPLKYYWEIAIDLQYLNLPKYYYKCRTTYLLHNIIINTILRSLSNYLILILDFHAINSQNESIFPNWAVLIKYYGSHYIQGGQ